MQRTPQVILALADVHGAYEAVERILSVEDTVQGIVIAGDLTTHGTDAEARTALRRFSAIAPIALVAGNMDPRSLESVFAQEGQYLNGRSIRWGDVALFGVSGSPPTPMHTPYEIPESEIEQLAEKGWNDSVDAPIKIFIPHAPPFGTSLDRLPGGRHVGSEAVRAFIERRQPDVVLCGHIHEARGQERIGRSVVVNCGPAHLGNYVVIHTAPEIRLEMRP